MALVGSPIRKRHWLDHQSDNSTELAVRQWHWLDHPSENGTGWITSQTTALNWQSDNGTGWITHQKTALAGSPDRQWRWITSQTMALDHQSDNVLSPSVLWPACPFTQCSVAGLSFHPVFCGRPVLSPSVLWPARPFTSCSVATRGRPNPGHWLASKHRELCISFHLQAPFGWSVNSHTQAPREQPSWFTLHQIQ